MRNYQNLIGLMRGGVRRSIRLGNYARDRASWKDAAVHYSIALKANPGLANIWMQLGHALKEQGELAGAADAYQQAIALLSDSTEVRLHLAHLFKRIGRYDAATVQFLRALHASGTPEPKEEEELLNLLLLQASADRQKLHEDLKAIFCDLPKWSKERPVINKIRGIIGGSMHKSDTFAGKGQGAALVFDVSDLIAYFKNARLPTGIQRVQIEAIGGALIGEIDRDVRLCCFLQGREDWLEIPIPLMLRISGLARNGGDRTDPAWVDALNDLHFHLSLTSAFQFPDGAYLINLGTSWWLQNYFLFVRQAKAKSNIRYVPFVHDMIPILAPQHCTRPLTQDFISWVSGVFDHADHFLVNSNATCSDLIHVAKILGHELLPDDIRVIPLDADFRKPGITELSVSALERWKLSPRGFVLFVSTIESRKGHLLAFDAWAALIQRHGFDNVPQLVCVGNRGWLNDKVYARLDGDPQLSSKVTMLSQLSDAELALLYKSCRFTLYPSFYEGWGLPVTESLCYGKVPLTSDAASLPEAGGAFAAYFASGSVSALTDQAETLIFDEKRLAVLEEKIRQQFCARSWSAVANQIVEELHHFVELDVSARTGRSVDVPLATPGRWSSLARNNATRIWKGMRSGEIYRSNLGWYWPEERGCRIRPNDGELTMRFDHGHGDLKSLVLLHGNENEDCEWIIQCHSQIRQGRLERSQDLWVEFDIPEEERPHLMEMIFHSSPIGNGNLTYFIKGFYIYNHNDLKARQDFLQAVLLGRLEQIDWSVDNETDVGREFLRRRARLKVAREMPDDATLLIGAAETGTSSTQTH